MAVVGEDVADVGEGATGAGGGVAVVGEDVAVVGEGATGAGEDVADAADSLAGCPVNRAWAAGLSAMD